jgi:hypothetical protein
VSCAAAAVEELPATRAQPWNDVLEVRSRGRSRTERHRIERPTTHGKQPETDEAAHELEPAVGDVLMRNPIRGKMQRRPER